jgi:hypothetical protein
MMANVEGCRPALCCATSTRHRRPARKAQASLRSALRRGKLSARCTRNARVMANSCNRPSSDDLFWGEFVAREPINGKIDFLVGPIAFAIVCIKRCRSRQRNLRAGEIRDVGTSKRFRCDGPECFAPQVGEAFRCPLCRAVCTGRSCHQCSRVFSADLGRSAG